MGKIERPINLTRWEVQQVLAGNKTQLRRLIKPQPPERYTHLHPESGSYGWFWSPSTSGDGAEQQDCRKFPMSTYGVVGDLLYVREHFSIHIQCPVWRADHPLEFEPPTLTGQRTEWLSPNKMPRWASRILLQVMAMRVCKLHTLTEAEAIREGCPGEFCNHTGTTCENCMNTGWLYPPTLEYYHQWERQYPECAWASNPWVRVIEFKILEKP